MIYALDLRAIWLLPVFWVDIPADRLSFVLEGKQNACWFYSNSVVRLSFLCLAVSRVGEDYQSSHGPKCCVRRPLLERGVVPGRPFGKGFLRGWRGAA